jgi:hypothetical protein
MIVSRTLCGFFTGASPTVLRAFEPFFPAHFVVRP